MSLPDAFAVEQHHHRRIESGQAGNLVRDDRADEIGVGSVAIQREVLIPRTAPVCPHMILNFLAEKVLELRKSY